MIENVPSANLSAEVQRHLGQYRAEYLRDGVFESFLQPSYWDRLLDSRPSLIIGGRGTGKTSTLKQLAYEGQYQSHGADMENWNALGLYWRIQTNLTAAFQGERISSQDWVRIFSHYVNLHFVGMLSSFVTWRETTLGIQTALDSEQLRRTCIALSMPEAGSFEEFSIQISDELIRFEAAINGPGERLTAGTLSMLGRPISTMVAAVLADKTLASPTITFCLDEYENFEPYQQRVINTLVKHVGDAHYTFKIGMRKNGLHDRATLSMSEYLTEPADFVSIDIEEEIKRGGFSDFAASICNERMRRIDGTDESTPTIKELLPELSVASELALLGAEGVRSDLRLRLLDEKVSNSLLMHFDQMSDTDACFVDFWSKAQTETPGTVLAQAASRPTEWKTRVGNHGYAMLFSLRSGKRGISKYYCGWNTFVQLADGNIRFLLFLVTESLIRHIGEGKRLIMPVSAETQTHAAQAVGERIVLELAGLDKRGTQLTRLVLGLGRVFGIMARDPFGHTPEITQFRIDQKSDNDVRELLLAGVMHSALIRFSGDKMASGSAETKDFDYQMHPIYAPFFVYSHRSKRRMTLSVGDFLGLAGPESHTYIKSLLNKTHRQYDPEVPEQMALFSEYYNGN